MKCSILLLLTTVVFMTSNILDILVMTTGKVQDIDAETYELLLPENIIQQWSNRIDGKALFYAAGYMNAIFWILFTLPVIELAWVLSRSGTQAIVWNVGMVGFVLGGAWTEWFSTIFWVGMNVASFNIADYYNLDVWLRPDLAEQFGITNGDFIGWRDLELGYIALSGMVWFVGIFEWLCLAGIFSFSFFSVVQWRTQEQSTFGARWNALGLFIGLLALVEFIVAIVMYEGYEIAGAILILYILLNRLILIPAWMISLAYQLPRATEKHFETHNEDYFVNGDDLTLSPSQGPTHPTFTIDDNDTYDHQPSKQGQPATTPPAARSPPPAVFRPPISPPAEAFASPTQQQMSN
jgi:hypothetical protein